MRLLWQVVEKCDHVFNLAADMGGMGFIQSNHSVIFYNNTMVTFNVLEAARQCNVKRCVPANMHLYLLMPLLKSSQHHMLFPHYMASHHCHCVGDRASLLHSQPRNFTRPSLPFCVAPHHALPFFGLFPCAASSTHLLRVFTPSSSSWTHKWRVAA